MLECESMSKARLVLTCGLPGAGKTTLAKEVATERCAVRLTKDEWQRALSVVLDFGLWARAERNELRVAARDLGIGVELHYLDVPPEELWRRIEARNSEPPWDDEPIGRADLDEWMTLFQAPDADELALYDPPPAGGPDRRR